jgi:hypothetical protein
VQLAAALIQLCKVLKRPLSIYSPRTDALMIRALRTCDKERPVTWDRWLEEENLNVFFVYLLFFGYPRSLKYYVAMCGVDYINDKLKQRAFSHRVSTLRVGVTSFESCSELCRDTVTTARNLGIRVDLLLEPWGHLALQPGLTLEEP